MFQYNVSPGGFYILCLYACTQGTLLASLLSELILATFQWLC